MVQMPIFGAILALRDKNKQLTLEVISQSDVQGQQLLFKIAQKHDPTFASQMRGKDFYV